MRRILLTSAGLTDPLRTLFFSQVGKPAEKLRVLFIPTAAAVDNDGAREGIMFCIAGLLQMGIPEENIFPYPINCILSDGYDRPYLPDVPPLYRRMTVRELLQFDLVLVGGGNAGFLMKELCRTGLNAPLKEAVEDGCFTSASARAVWLPQAIFRKACAGSRIPFFRIARSERPAARFRKMMRFF